MQLPTQIHGHDVIDFMIAAKMPFARATLLEAMQVKFGPEARYHTCSAENMTADQLIDFLAQRGKFKGSAAAFTVDTDRVCRH